MNNMLPCVFADCFIKLKQIHKYNIYQCQMCKLFLATVSVVLKTLAKIFKKIKQNSHHSFKYKYKLFFIKNYASDTKQ